MSCERRSLASEPHDHRPFLSYHVIPYCNCNRI